MTDHDAHFCVYKNNKVATARMCDDRYLVLRTDALHELSSKISVCLICFRAWLGRRTRYYEATRWSDYIE